MRTDKLPVAADAKKTVGRAEVLMATHRMEMTVSSPRETGPTGAWQRRLGGPLPLAVPLSWTGPRVGAVADPENRMWSTAARPTCRSSQRLPDGRSDAPTAAPLLDRENRRRKPTGEAKGAATGAAGGQRRGKTGEKFHRTTTWRRSMQAPSGPAHSRVAGQPGSRLVPSTKMAALLLCRCQKIGRAHV